MDVPSSTEPIPNALKSSDVLMGSSTSLASIDGVLDISLHHARDIHNICIYGNQDVYAKFSITHTQDAVYSTQPLRGGGKNPMFNQSLQILISKLDAVLKCEIWMMSCARTYLEDQLLGFVLVPLCDIFGQGRVTKDYSLSSTDLFHAPAGIVSLSLTFYLRGSEIPLYVDASWSNKMLLHNIICRSVDSGTHDVASNGTHDVTSDDALEASANGSHLSTAMEYNNIEFPDLQSVCENQSLVSLYLKMASSETHMDEDACGQGSGLSTCPSGRDHFSRAPFLQLGCLPMTDCEDEMGMEKAEEGSYQSQHGHALPSSESDLSLNTSTAISAAMSKTEEVNPLDSKSILSVDVGTQCTQESSSSQASPSATSSMLGRSSATLDGKVSPNSNGQESHSSSIAPMVSISLEPEEPVVQQQIVDMYMKSMQQFTESLAKMKLPIDLESSHSLEELEREPPAEKQGPTSEPAIKDGHRVFYGSRAFF